MSGNCFAPLHALPIHAIIQQALTGSPLIIQPAPPPGAGPNWAKKREAKLAKFAKNTRRRHKKYEKRVREDAERSTTTHIEEGTSEVTRPSRWDN